MRSQRLKMRVDFNRTLREAIREFAEHGYDSKARLDYWLDRIRAAAGYYLPPEQESKRKMEHALASIYEKLFRKEKLKTQHQGVTRFDLASIPETFRPILQRRILAATDLIKLNRTKAVETTLSRFSGWASSVPAGGSRSLETQETVAHIAKPLRSQTYEERRLAIDQGHKLSASINQTLAESGGAIAVIWNDHGVIDKRYHARPDHLERSGKIYTLRDNWAQKAGLMKPGPAGYLDEVTMFGEEPFCRCWGTYLYNLQDLPDDMLTQKGKAAEGR